MIEHKNRNHNEICLGDYIKLNRGFTSELLDIDKEYKVIKLYGYNHLKLEGMEGTYHSRYFDLIPRNMGDVEDFGSNIDKTIIYI